MGTVIEQETKLATADGFYGGRRLRKGDTFTAPVEEKGAWFKPRDRVEEDAVEADHIPDLLDKGPFEIVDELPKLGLAELRALQAAEQAGKTRKGLLAKIADAIANAEANPPQGGGEAPDGDLMS